MLVENALYPTPERVQTLIGDADPGAVVMLNLLKFREHAVYGDGRSTNLTGREAYNLYGMPMREIVEREGGKLLFHGEVTGLIVGEVGELWDVAALMQYPSSAAFARIATSPEVAEIGVHRSAGLAGQLLIRVVGRMF